MKKTLLMLLITATGLSAYAQTPTNTFPNTGNVGIGTTTPAKPLVVRGIDQDAAINILSQDGSDLIGIGYNPLGAVSNGMTLFLNTLNGTPTLTAWDNGTVSIGQDYAIRQDGGGAADNGLLVEGNVGIGTTNPQGYQLAVNGSAIATSFTVKVYTNWPDYVFKKSYKLPLLTDIKTYIDQNHHLPEMPSQEQIAKDGLNLGEMNKLLVKKVEELTLYTISSDKEINEEKTVLAQQQVLLQLLQNQLKAQQKMIDKLTNKR